MNGLVSYEGAILSGNISINTEAQLEELTADHNGVYLPSQGKDGFSKVTVDVPDPVLDDITITENGHYTPPAGIDGYNDIVVSVPHPAPVLDDITITENGSYQPPTGVDGYDNITVNVLPALDDITITENGSYTPPSGTDGYDEITVNVPLPANGIYKQTLSGLPSPIATFTGADAPIDSLKASIVGTQDLHGYDHPWPAGGGKNKWEFNSSLSGNGNILSGKVFTNQIPLGTFTLSSKGTFASGGAMAFRFVYTDDTTKDITLGYNVQSGTYYVSAVFEKAVKGLSYVYSNNANNNINSIQLEQGETATSYVPYSNICPISGWSSCEVTDNNDTYTIPFKDSSDNPITVYGGGIDISGGKLTVTHANIASYNGETINDPWISSEDIYMQGATPTTGAQVVYPLTTPLIYDFDPLALRSNGVTNISADCGEVTELKYYSETP